jgi:hypothetical protein
VPFSLSSLPLVPWFLSCSRAFRVRIARSLARSLSDALPLSYSQCRYGADSSEKADDDTAPKLVSLRHRQAISAVLGKLAVDPYEALHATVRCAFCKFRLCARVVARCAFEFRLGRAPVQSSV